MPIRYWWVSLGALGGFKSDEHTQSQLSDCADFERPFLLQQYANICVNRRELGLDGYR